jgi:arginyl-tRNA synthetase
MPQYTFEKFKEQSAATLAATGLVPADALNLTDPKPNIPADLAFPTFQAARAGGGNPAEFANKVAAAAQPEENSLVGKIEAAGPFVNISVAPDKYAQAVLNEVLTMGAEHGKSDIGDGQKLIVEYSSPNIARKMHVGHLRTTIIGNSVKLILQKLGYNVVSDNHLGDWGTQFGSLLAAIDIWGLPGEVNTDPIEALVQIYSKFHNASQEDPTLRDLAREWFLKLEQGDPKAREQWTWMVDITLQEFQRTYDRLGVSFDMQHGESFYEPMLNTVINEALDKGVAKVEADGAISVSFDDKLPSYLLRKRDGATLYQTRDVATCIWRWNEIKPDRNIYVVGQEQKLHFQQVFETVRRLGYTEIADRSVHISFGPVTDVKGERFSMRKGTAIFLDEVLDEALQRASAVVAQKIEEGKTDLSEAEQSEVSQKVGIGAVVYNDLYQDPGRGIRFDWDKMLSFDGNSAPYIQYTYARCKSILRKSGQTPKADAPEYALLTNPEEQAVIKALAKFPLMVQRAGADFLPAIVAGWTYDLARDFARFYHEHSVLDAPTPKLVVARLGLVQAVATGLQNGLHLLGISTVERM